MNLGTFTAAGIAAFQRFLDSQTTPAPLPWPASALEDSSYSTPASAQVSLAQREFLTRFELAEYLHRQFAEAGFSPAPDNMALWAWIACRYFRELCPKGSGGVWKPGSIARWIPASSNYRRYYRHIVVGPYSIFRAHRDNPRRALALLCQAPGRPGDVVEQLASRQQLVTNPTIVSIATRCFVDPTTDRQRKRAGGKGAGSARRLVDVLSQFEVTWDLSTVSESDLFSMLPTEFKERGVSRRG